MTNLIYTIYKTLFLDINENIIEIGVNKYFKPLKKNFVSITLKLVDAIAYIMKILYL